MPIEHVISSNALIELVRTECARIVDHRAANSSIALTDALMSAFAMFALKDSSLLAFDARRTRDTNLKQLYGLQQVPCDTQMRQILDPVDPAQLRPIFTTIFAKLQQKSMLRPFLFLETHYLIALDGTGYFSSKKVHCPNCLERKNRTTGEITYAHQMLAGAIVHPDQNVVIPLAPEPIIKQDGSTKNDCERNAAKRFVEKLRQEYPDLPFIITEDALSSNAPHIELLQEQRIHFILGVKPGDHPFLFTYVEAARQRGETTEHEQSVNGVLHRFRFLNDVPINEANQHIRVNFMEYWEIDGDKQQHFTWVTDIYITEATEFSIMRGGRARWKIENETFNTLKNQGYHFEHNYGHGEQNLSVVFAMLMFLAFLVDQIQQLASTLFQVALTRAKSKKQLWEQIRALFYVLEWESFDELLRAIGYGYRITGKIVFGPT